MTKETIKHFSQMHAEPEWLANLRQAAFDKIEELKLPVIERVKFHRWNLGDGTLSESETLTNVPDFTALNDHLTLVQVGTQTVLEQLPADLAEQGVIFTQLILMVEQCYISQIMLKSISPLKAFFTKTVRATCHLTSTF